MQRYALLLSYIGGKYCGWQKQIKADEETTPSIQQTIEDIIFQITRERVSLIGSGRTDAGVHAVGQVAHFTLEQDDYREDLLLNGLNSQLPHDIRVQAALRVNDGFHAQRSAVKKQYSYYFAQGRSPYPHLAPFSHWVRKELNIDAMNKALRPLIGTHDFTVFKARGSLPGVKPVKTLFEADVTRVAPNMPGELSTRQASLVRFRVVGSGFLKQMVRAMAGTLIEIGEGKRSPESLIEVVNSKKREDLGRTAPPRGLWLEHVWYEDLQF